ncbi:hypothetical protein M885DRAFT_508754 [Pelagophyceae sp. CCMP2097]|nr:hypothetical protein M885DRAFT_508754 [Pelagophyceae sp. CCMP2097]
MAVLSAVVAASPGVDRETVDAAMDDMVRSSLDDLEEGLDASGRRTLHFALYEAFQASPSEEKQKSAQVFALKYLKSFAGESMPPSAVGLAQKTAVAALKDPFTWFRDRADLLAIPPLAALARSEEADDVALHALLVVFATLSYAQFAPLASKHAALFKKKGLVVADLETKMRLVSLCALAAESDAVPYAAVASALQVELAEVEAWVVKAITADLVECKMDQLQKVVCVSRCCLFRSTGLEDWLSVQQQLVHWKANIEKLRDTLARARTAVA